MITLIDTQPVNLDSESAPALRFMTTTGSSVFENPTEVPSLDKDEPVHLNLGANWLADQSMRYRIFSDCVNEGDIDGAATASLHVTSDNLVIEGLLNLAAGTTARF